MARPRERWRSPGLPAVKQDFEPLTPGGHRVAEHQYLPGRPEHTDDPKAFGRWAADRIEEAIQFEDGHCRRGGARAGAELRWLFHPAAWLLRPGAEDLRQV